MCSVLNWTFCDTSGLGHDRPKRCRTFVSVMLQMHGMQIARARARAISLSLSFSLSLSLSLSPILLTLLLHVLLLLLPLFFLWCLRNAQATRVRSPFVKSPLRQEGLLCQVNKKERKPRAEKQSQSYLLSRNVACERLFLPRDAGRDRAGQRYEDGDGEED